MTRRNGRRTFRGREMNRNLPCALFHYLRVGSIPKGQSTCLPARSTGKGSRFPGQGDRTPADPGQQRVGKPDGSPVFAVLAPFDPMAGAMFFGVDVTTLNITESWPTSLA